MIFHFEFRGDRGWEAMGAAEGRGEDALANALDDLRLLHGGLLPAGRYQYIAAIGGEPRWRGFDLGDDGLLVA